MMRNYEFYFYTTDESFDYGDFTHKDIVYHGFTLELDKDDNVDFASLEGWGDYSQEIDAIRTAKGLRDYVQEHLDEVLEWDEDENKLCTNYELFCNLIDILDRQIKRERQVA